MGHRTGKWKSGTVVNRALLLGPASRRHDDISNVPWREPLTGGQQSGLSMAEAGQA